MNWRGGPSFFFNSPFTVVAGDSGASKTPNSITFPGTSATVYNGVLKFPGPITTLSVTAQGAAGSNTVLTFGVQAVAEPSSWAMMSLALGSGAAAVAWRRRRQPLDPA